MEYKTLYRISSWINIFDHNIEALEGCVTLEFTRDLPLFHIYIFWFESILRIRLCSSQYVQTAQTKELATTFFLSGSGGSNFGRCLFTKSLSKLSDLITSSLTAISNVLKEANISNQLLRDELKLSICPIFEELAKEDLTRENRLLYQMQESCTLYENLLEQSLRNRRLLSETEYNTILKARCDYEIERFDLVE